MDTISGILHTDKGTWILFQAYFILTRVAWNLDTIPGILYTDKGTWILFQVYFILEREPGHYSRYTLY